MTRILVHVSKSSITSTPGPAAYYVQPRSNSPRYSIRGRGSPEPVKQGGEFVSLPSTFGNAPKYTIAPRRYEKIRETSPGPNYDPPSLAKTARGISIGHRARPPKINDNPGPGQYDVKTARNLSPIKIGARRSVDMTSNRSPGPAAYCPDYSNTIHSPRKIMIGLRHDVEKKQELPGYVALGSTFSGPKFTIKGRDTSDAILI